MTDESDADGRQRHRSANSSIRK